MITLYMAEGAAIALIVLLLAGTLAQMFVAMQTREAVGGGRATRFICVLYGAQAVASLAALLEIVLAYSAVEEGLLLTPWPHGRVLSALPALTLACSLVWPAALPRGAHTPYLSCLVPLLRLPLLDGLPWPLPQAVMVFSTVWLLADALFAAADLRKQARAPGAPGALRHVVGQLGQGVAVAGRGGWFLERNPAFDAQCHQLGIPQTLDHTQDLEKALTTLAEEGKIRLSGSPDGRLIRSGSRSWLLRQESFRVGSTVYQQVNLSDISAVDRAALRLERRNASLAAANGRLKQSIAAVERETADREREVLARSAHDEWAQRLAMAGLSVDMLLGSAALGGGMTPAQIARQLDMPDPAGEGVTELRTLLPILSENYASLGMRIHTQGDGDFTGSQQAALCAVLREASANAVRHAYATALFIDMEQTPDHTRLTIANDCLDGDPSITLGRGLYDMRRRIEQAGGAIVFHKDRRFVIDIRFPWKEATK